MDVVPHAELAVDRGYRVVEAPVAGAIFLDHQVLVTVAPAETAATTLRLSSLRGISFNTWQSPSLNPAFSIGAVRCGVDVGPRCLLGLLSLSLSGP